ncbi:MAG: large conductance mechanosensitive channel protein MscL [Acidimicrobiales bacterium]|nr:large conductance mechanosensitive channel protein MscL [Acidimicrobiales bacterium]
MIQDLKAFLMKGNIVDLAVAVIIGVAFGAVVTAMVDNIITPIIAAVFGEPDISAVLAIDIGDATMRIGAFLQAVLDFAIIGTVLFFIVKAYEATQKKEEEVAAPSDEVVLLTEIRDSLRAQG